MTQLKRYFLFPFLLTLGLSGATPASAAGAPAKSELASLLDEYWQFFQRENPEAATAYGEYQYNHQLRDLSPERLQQAGQQAAALLQRLQALDSAGLSEAERLDQAILLNVLHDYLEGLRLQKYLMPLDQVNGIHLQLANLVALAPFESVLHYEDYLVRLQQVPRLLRQVQALLAQGRQQGMMPPRYLLEKVQLQLRELHQPPAASNVFARPLQRFSHTIPAAEQQRLRRAVLQVIEDSVRPAYRELEAYVAQDYAPHGRQEPGMWALPDGAERYRYAVRTQTSSTLDPEHIHKLGLTRVAELEGQIAELAKSAGYPDAATFVRAVHAAPRNKPRSRRQILDDYRRHLDAMQARVPALFGLLPKSQLIVTSVPAYLEKDGSTQYLQGTADGKRAGQVWVNTYDHRHQSMLENEATAYHEGWPGHHLQISIAQELTGLHAYRRSLNDQYNAYIEGWALYAEKLGKEIGFYQDTASDLGRLESELFRAVRLVLDTGVHYRRWSRRQMLDYCAAHLDKPMEAEVDRYIADPGQALSYTLGQLKILELRQRAQSALGPRFELRAFHDRLLDAGALPLDLLEARIVAWITSQR